jgi:PPOX class probable F420-dependent enzyme
MALKVGPRLRAFFEEPIPITIGTTRRDGRVLMHPVWFEYRPEEGMIWLNGGPKRAWFQHLKRDPRISLQLVDPKNMFRQALIEGRLVDTTFDGADDHIDRLSQRYLGGPYRNPKVERMIVRIMPERISGYEGGTPWDVSET